MYSLTKKTEHPHYSVVRELDHLPVFTVTQAQLDEVQNEGFDRLISGQELADSTWTRLLGQYYSERIVHVRSNQTLLLRFEGSDYEIDLDDINSEADLLRWALHLCNSKNWMNTERLAAFIEAVGHIKKFRIYGF